MDEKFYPFSNDLMFCEVLNSSPEIAKRIIEIILDKPISNISSVEAQKTENYSINTKGVRFDVFIKDEENTHYDVEIQTSRYQDLPKRMRYYQSANDSTYIKRGDTYDALPESYIIFICTGDPFGLNEALYRIQSTCLEHLDMYYNEGVYKIVLNSQGNKDNISKELKEFLEYIETNKPGDDELCKTINNKVNEINMDGDWRHQAMTLDEKIRFEKKLSKEEGKVEGKEEGKEEAKSMLLLDLEKLVNNSSDNDEISDKLKQYIKNKKTTNK